MQRSIIIVKPRKTEYPATSHFTVHSSLPTTSATTTLPHYHTTTLLQYCDTATLFVQILTSISITPTPQSSRDHAGSNPVANSKPSPRVACCQRSESASKAAHEPTQAMSDISLQATVESEVTMRQLDPHWDAGLIAASIAISFLGAFTSTQLWVPHHHSNFTLRSNSDHPYSMCQARMSLHFSSVLIWTILGSLTFGFCSIWSLHFVAMLAYELDLPIGIDVPLTLLSAVLAVLFTFVALASDLLWDTYMRSRRRNYQALRKERTASSLMKRSRLNSGDPSSERLLDPIEEEEEEEEGEGYEDEHQDAEDSQSTLRPKTSTEQDRNGTFSPDTPPETPPISPQPAFRLDPGHKLLGQHLNGSAVGTSTKLSNQSPEPTTPTRAESPESSTGFPGFPKYQRRPSDQSISRRSDSFVGPLHSSYGLSNLMTLAYRGTSPAKNAFIATGEALYAGCTRRNIIKGFLWSLAITSMHYVGITALRIPQGNFRLEPLLVVLSALISWAVCLVGCILMSQIETHLAQQFLFAIVACIGVAAMHFTGTSIQV